MQEPVNQYNIRLREQLKAYRTIQKSGGFPLIIMNKKILSVEDSDSCLFNLKKYLVLSNDLEINDNSIIFTDSLAYAVQSFQKRKGLSENGKINQQTIK